MAPHPKRDLTSPFGRLVDRTTSMDVILIIALVLVFSTLWFRFAPTGHGLKDPGADLGDCAYFTLVTFTSLGYGELVPVGFGRFVAVVDVLSGLALTAVLIGKVASERQSTIMMLLHTSDTQRRISDFAMELEKTRALIQSLAEKRSIRKLNLALESHLRLTKAIRNYLMFNAHQAAIVEFGNFTVLIGLYDEIKASFDALNRTHRYSRMVGDAMVMRRLLSNMSNLHQIVKRMGAIHHKPKGGDPLWQTALRALHVIQAAPPPPDEQFARGRIKSLEHIMGKMMADAEHWVETGHHPIQIERVHDAFPAGPQSSWPSGIHKTVAAQLGISNTVAARCITDLLSANRLPKLADEPAEKEKAIAHC